MSALTPGHGHTVFESLLPHLRRQAYLRFRHLNPCDREEAIANAVAYGFASFLRLRARGKDPTRYPVVFAQFVARAVANGRGIIRRFSRRDLMSTHRNREWPGAHRFGIPVPGGWWRDAVMDHRARVADQAIFNIDFPAWLHTLSTSKRRIAELLAQGHRTEDAAGLTGLTASRVSQLRRELADSWVNWQVAD